MWGIALLVFREVLEAALIVTIVAAATRGVSRRALFIGGGIGLGVIGAVLVAAFAGLIADAASGFGQEFFNAGVLLAAVAMIGWHVIWMSSHGRELARHMQSVGSAVSTGASSLGLLLAVVALAVLREGSEIVLFLYGMIAGGAADGLVTGVSIGVAAGVTVGLALYFGLLRIPLKYFFSVTNWMLVLLASGLAASAAGFLVQGNLLPAWGNQLWDSAWLLSNGSVPGQVLHILIGYDATPSGMALAFYGVTLVVLVTGMQWMQHRTGRSRPARPAEAAVAEAAATR